ncbi:NAD-dependent epimerase/dehydratase family protein [Geomesophilobacter sediminis]|uniref:NAD(P)-dependent oxidoreductase n=1 Tax=Geomesophilobacter sediminis TaxID=2798584 RepID=A0A8J7M2X6_9BACT|nr:NAD(P)-dependent oxidoreductase [Geomesophilobacter sediminis]MBJ6727755.1 NAD(P)-dependent oxidoreductase [Geomesophilobacter sediminis]
MKVLVTGGTGFIGRYAVASLLERGHQVTLLVRPGSAAQPPDGVATLPCDLQNPPDLQPLAGHDALLHLAWPDLDNYRALRHLSETLGEHCRFLELVVRAGVPRLLVAGTCFEYGLQNGPLTEECPTAPILPYPQAKDTLRRFLQALQREIPFRLTWTRLFYMHGAGQNPRSLIAQLDRAIDAGAENFAMSGGEQLRDYSPVGDIAERLVRLLERRDFDGIVNVCSGTPISVRRLVEEHIARRGASIRLELGRYPYPEWEPMAFWGDAGKLKQLTA